MRSVSILDCTLRDGGYINSWKFGEKTIKDIINKLETSRVDIVECGFLKDVEYDIDSTVYDNANRMSKAFVKKKGTMYVGMIALGDIIAEKIDVRTPDSIDGIRLTFHKHEVEEEFLQARILIDKGYEVFIQPVGTSTYSDKELVELIEKVNKIRPFAFYIVDTLGTMYPSDLQRIFSIIDHNLDSRIRIGFHSHNNLQLSFSNAQMLMSFPSKHDIIIDSSVFGMGRGAGNLATELIVQYINKICDCRYNVVPLLTIMDKYLNSIFINTPWGYASPYFLSAISLCHPNYANYLMTKKTLTIENISKILNLIPVESRGLYDKNLVEKLYLEFQSSKIEDSNTISELYELFKGKSILIIASGSSTIMDRDKIQKWIFKHDAFTIHINDIKTCYKADALFISNSLKAENLELENIENTLILATSNIQKELKGNVKRVDYASLLGNNSESDNAGLMAITLLAKAGVKKIALAGFDGFSYNPQDYIQYVSESYLQKDIDARNEQISNELIRLSQEIDMTFITSTIYRHLG